MGKVVATAADRIVLGTLQLNTSPDPTQQCFSISNSHISSQCTYPSSHQQSVHIPKQSVHRLQSPDGVITSPIPLPVKGTNPRTIGPGSKVVLAWSVSSSPIAGIAGESGKPRTPFDPLAQPKGARGPVGVQRIAPETRVNVTMDQFVDTGKRMDAAGPDGEMHTTSFAVAVWLIAQMPVTAARSKAGRPAMSSWAGL